MGDYKEFALGAVLSVTTGRLLCDIGGVYEILNHMTGENLFTHQLPRASGVCRPVLMLLHPKLKEADIHLPMLDKLLDAHTDRDRDVAEGLVYSWVYGLTDKHGFPESYKIWPMSQGLYETKDPIDELIDIKESQSSIGTTSN